MKIKRIGVSWDLLKNLLAQDNFIPAVRVTADGLPADAIACGIQMYDGKIFVDVSSDSFDEVPEGSQIPMLNPCFETVQPHG